MCGRFVSPDEAAFEREWSLHARDAVHFKSYNVCPSQTVPVIMETLGQPHQLYNMVWSFQRGGSDKKHINARSETVFEKWTFRDAARRQRCIVPVAGWYEWDRSVDPRQPYYHTRSDGKSFGLAGIWELTGESSQDAHWSFALLTTAANDWASPVHHRMPVVLDPFGYSTWLSQDTPIDKLTDLLGYAINSDGFELYPVSRAVNSPKNNTIKCIAQKGA